MPPRHSESILPKISTSGVPRIYTVVDSGRRVHPSPGFGFELLSLGYRVTGRVEWADASLDFRNENSLTAR